MWARGAAANQSRVFIQIWNEGSSSHGWFSFYFRLFGLKKSQQNNNTYNIIQNQPDSDIWSGSEDPVQVDQSQTSGPDQRTRYRWISPRHLVRIRGPGTGGSVSEHPGPCLGPGRPRSPQEVPPPSRAAESPAAHKQEVVISWTSTLTSDITTTGLVMSSHHHDLTDCRRGGGASWTLNHSEMSEVWGNYPQFIAMWR